MKTLFLGEGNFDGSARYLAAILKYAKLPFDHLPDEARIPRAWMKRRYSAFVLSDYRHASWTRESESWMLDQVREGAKLLMIGGWASFRGLVGHYAGSAIADALPVVCTQEDDRRNRLATLLTPQGCPIVCGYHEAKPKPGTRTVHEFQDLDILKGKPRLGKKHPALVTGLHGRGKTTAFLTDCAPHWAGGLVDWGPRRIRVLIGRGETVEVGDRYLAFFGALLKK